MEIVHRMLIRLLLSAVVVLTATSANSQGSNQLQTDYAAANQKLLDGDAKGAVELYEHILESEMQDGNLLYNLGNAYAMLNKPLQAVIAYEKSLLLRPNFEDAFENLLVVRKALDPKFDPQSIRDAPKDPLDTVRSVVGNINLNVAALSLLLSNALFFLAIICFRRFSSVGLRKGMIVSMLVTGLATLILAGITLGHGYLEDDKLAISSTSTSMRTGPNARFESTAKISRGARVRILAQQGDWVEVKSRRGTMGWVPLSELTILNMAYK